MASIGTGKCSDVFLLFLNCYVVNCRFLGSGCQPTEAVLWTCGSIYLEHFQTFLNAAHAHSLPTFGRHVKHFYFSFYYTKSAFNVVTVNALYKLLTYLLTGLRFVSLFKR